MENDMLDRGRILDLFGKLDAKMQAEGIEANIYVVGGAAIRYACPKTSCHRSSSSQAA